MPLVYQRVKNVREFRLASKRAATRKFADMPTRFAQITQPEGADFILVPLVSSERRKYVPIDYVSSEIICGDSNQMIPNAQIYHFGILTSSIHMTWLRTVAGRLKSDYRYSKDVVYNNFIWCEATLEQKSLIEATAQKILEVRAQFPSATLAELYDEVTMPYELREAHKKNDVAVAKAYNMENILEDEPKIAVELLKLYESLTKT